MQERNVISGVAASALSPFIENQEALLTWAIVSTVLIIVDLRFGWEAAKKRGDKPRKSRAARRTINKFVDYICWIAVAWVLGGSFGNIFGIPFVAASIMLVVCAIEVSSIVDNYFEARGIKKKFNIFKFFTALFKVPIEESIEDKKE